MIKAEAIQKLNRHHAGEVISASKENRKNLVLDRMADRPGPARQVIGSPVGITTVDAKPLTGFWITAGASGINGITTFGEYDRFTNSISLERSRYTPNGATTDIAGDTEFVYLMSTSNQVLYEYDAKTLTMLRKFEMSWQNSQSGYPFTKIFPILYQSILAIAYENNMMILIGRNSLEYRFDDQLAIIDFEGEDRTPTVRGAPKNTEDIFSGSEVPTGSVINAIAIGDGVLYSVSGKGYHTNIDFQTLRQAGFVFNDTELDSTPTGAKIVGGQYYMGNRNVEGNPHTIEHRDRANFDLLSGGKVESYLPFLRGIG